MKGTVVLSWDQRVVVSPHIGEMDSPRSLRVFEQVARDPMPTEPTGAPDVSAEQSVVSAEQAWDDESTEVEVIDESDFVLLVDEGDLEELEKVGEDDAGKTRPPAIPAAEAADEADDEEGFFKKLFGGKRTSSRPKPPGG